jgi:Flp pilus assembly pilin Flp
MPTCPFRSVVTRFLHCSSGATSLEYAFIATLISIAAVAIWTSIGTTTVSLYSGVLPALSN